MDHDRLKHFSVIFEYEDSYGIGLKELDRIHRDLDPLYSLYQKLALIVDHSYVWQLLDLDKEGLYTSYKSGMWHVPYSLPPIPKSKR